MTATPTAAPETPAQMLLPPPAPASQTLQFATMLGDRDVSVDRFEATVREVAESLGGALLFHLGIGNAGERQCVAAVVLGNQAPREIAIVDLPAKGSASVKTASESDLPVAAIAQAYAGLADCWGKAA
jgi:hypothetical protein